MINRAFPGAYSCSMKSTFLFFFFSFLNCKHGSGANIILSSCKDYLPVLRGSAQAREGKDTFAVRFPCSKNVPEAVAPFHWFGTNFIELQVFQKQHFSFAETVVIYLFIFEFQFRTDISSWFPMGILSC